MAQPQLGPLSHSNEWLQLGCVASLAVSHSSISQPVGGLLLKDRVRWGSRKLCNVLSLDGHPNKNQLLVLGWAQ
jgi:hypothetical protein